MFWPLRNKWLMLILTIKDNGCVQVKNALQLFSFNDKHVIVLFIFAKIGIG